MITTLPNNYKVFSLKRCKPVEYIDVPVSHILHFRLGNFLKPNLKLRLNKYLVEHCFRNHAWHMLVFSL